MSLTPTKILKEKDIEQYLVKRVKALKGEVRKLQWFGRSNAPDRLVTLPVRGIWLVEIKRPGKFPTAAQQREIDRINRAGGQATWVNSFEMVDEFLKG